MPERMEIKSLPKIAGLVFLSLSTAALSLAVAAPKSVERMFQVRIKPEEIVRKPVSPWIYGNFIEDGFAHQVDRMWAEMLWNRSFEEISPYQRVFWDELSRQPGDDLTRDPWWHSGYEENPWYLDAANPDAEMRPSPFYNFRHGLQSMIVINKSKTRKAVLAQDGLRLRKGLNYNFRGWIGTGETSVEESTRPVKIKVGLYPEKRFGTPLDEKEFSVANGDLREYRAEFKAGDFEGWASLGISVESDQRVAADAFSLTPADNVRGWRKEVIGALKRLHPPIIRFPGGCFASYYRWRDGIGPRDDRRPAQVPFWGGLDNNDVGVAELMDLCREIGAEPFYCLNMLTGSAGEAADLAAYCNADASSPLGALRASHGYPAPFKIKYWELDNEPMRKFGALEYARRCVEFAGAVKAVDPAAKFVMVGYFEAPVLARMLEIAGGSIDGITDRALGESELLKDLEIIRAYNKTHGRSIFLCNTEWIAPQEVREVLPGAVLNPGEELSGPLPNRRIRWGYAMTSAAELLRFQRLGGDFLWANFNNMANTWGGNVIECAKEGVWLSAAGCMFELLATSPAAWPLAHEVIQTDPLVLFQSAWNTDRKKLVLQILNFGTDKVAASFDLRALGFAAGKAELQQLWADSLQARNRPSNAPAIRKESSAETLQGRAIYTTTLPSCSLTLIVLSSDDRPGPFPFDRP
jgi:alpha-L-arabinofuranosidase